MVTVRPKTRIELALTGIGETHARTRVTTRDVATIVDEPLARGGTNLGPSPTETLMASLIACTNVITQRIAARDGVAIGSLEVEAHARLDRRGAALEQEVEKPFSDIRLEIRVSTDATPEQLETIKADLTRFCPIAKVIRGSGVPIAEEWVVSPLAGG